MNTKNTLQKHFDLAAVFVFLGAVGLLAGVGCTSQPGNTAGQTEATLKAVDGRYADVDIVEAAPGVWRMFYGVEPETPNHQFEMYSAFSQNGETWTAQPDPVLAWATFPDIVKLPDGNFRLYFQDAQQRIIASAISTDGITFTREAGVRIVPNEDSGTGGVGAPTVVQLPDNTYLMVYRVSENKPYSPTSINPTTTSFYSARSPEGLNFTVGEKILDGANATFDGYIDGPELVMMDDGKLHLRFWSSAGQDNQDDAGHYEMLSDDFGLTWGNPVLIYPSESTGIIGGDPTYIKINGRWLMFYTRYGEGIFYQPL